VGVFVERGHQPLIVAADARLDNRDELIATLELELHGSRCSLTDAQLIACAYRRWGPDGVGHLLGAFAFVLWDLGKRWLICARDHMGPRPLYYRRTAQRFVFASEVKQILALQDSPAIFDETTIGLHLAGTGTLHESTYFSGIMQVAPAHLLIVTPDGERRRRYWDIDPRLQIRCQDDAEYGEKFRDLFIEAVRCRLRAHESTGFVLSGGLDSSAVASVSGWLHRRGEDVPWPLHTFSWLFDELSSADEREYSTAVNEAYGLTPHGVAADHKWPLRDDPEGITDLDEPFAGCYQQLAKATLQVACDVGIEVLLTGHPGDSLVGGNIFAYPDYLLRGQWVRLARELWQHSRQAHLTLYGNVFQLFWHTCARLAAPWWLKRHYRSLPIGKRSALPDWIVPGFATRIGLESLVKELNRPPSGFEVSKAARYRVIFHPYPLKIIIARSRLAARLGITYREPWLDKRLIEFMMAVPTDQTIRGGLRKIVLRNALQGILPDKVRTRRGKADPIPLAHRGLRERARFRVEDLLTNTRMAEYGWVLEEPMRKHYARYLAGELDTEWPLWQALTLELWLREHF
jgi:asparagine synthase (glutamine-hydrolysing)